MQKQNKIFKYDAVVVGSGAAGFNAINRIKEAGLNCALITEGINLGTSRNTGSDKQTYYKLGLSGNTLDSVNSMAENLFAPGSVDGDNALIEASLSPRCFLNLCELGVAFPHNRYGEYIGYKTDHDPFERATSAGPLTSKFMTEALEKRAKQLGVKILDNLYVIKILKERGKVVGLAALETINKGLVFINSPYVILATGGPAGIYLDSVYPTCHTGSTSLAINAGAKLQNISEWQYGLASINPRWNVSGTYMQVLPRFVSIDEKNKEHEFLLDYFKDKYDALNNVFLKGYQWPFDSNKVLKGSSVIDLLVYKECALKNRRVYLDYKKNPFDLKEIDYKKLSQEARDYLTKAGANKFKTPIDRLKHMNQPAIDLYKSKGLDITKKYLEIALCAQHHNGGIAVDKWWETSVEGLFACGECAGTHGVSRPGGSALNAGQVGSLRASQFIVAHKKNNLDDNSFNNIVNKVTSEHLQLLMRLDKKKEDNVKEKIQIASRRMSNYGAAIRNYPKMLEALNETKKEFVKFEVNAHINNLVLLYKYKDILLTQLIVLSSLIEFSNTIKKTRGSALYYQENGQLRKGLDEIFRFIPDDGNSKDKIQEIIFNGKNIRISWRKVRAIPHEDNFFENVWRRYRQDKNIY